MNYKKKGIMDHVRPSRPGVDEEYDSSIMPVANIASVAIAGVNGWTLSRNPIDMRITLLTTGSRGDIQPFLALAVGLKRAGHEPVLATNDPFGPFIESHGIPFHMLGGDVRALLETGEGRKLLSAWVPKGIRRRRSPSM